MVKTYVLAPNWTTAPPPDGPIMLGHVLDDLTELVPLNRDSVVDTSKLLNRVDTKSGFTTSRSRLVSGELGVFARVLGLVGVGAGADAQYKRDRSDVLSCTTLDTETFDPTPGYISDTMDLPEIKRFMKNGKYREPVYMITGLKIGRGGSLQSSDSTEGGVKLEGGLNPPGSPAQVGGKTGVTVKKTEGESWNESTDFIVALRVRKIWYHHGELKHKTNKDKVVMQDGTPALKEQDLLLHADDDVPLDDIITNAELMVDKDVEDGEEVNWIIPNVGTDIKAVTATT